jgi:hypothetical protein
VFSWGRCRNGRLGLGPTEKNVSSPSLVALPSERQVSLVPLSTRWF